VHEDVARAIFAPADAIACGVFAPMGRARRVDGGFRVSGRWPVASGCEHSRWRTGGAIVEGDAPLASGAPDVRTMIFPAADAHVVDTWDVSGLRGTGSHDIEVKDVFVPAEMSYSLVTDRPRHTAAIYALPVFGFLAAGVAAVTIGIARSAIDAFVALAKAKQPMGAKRSIAHREIVQLSVARAEAKVRAARAGLRDALGEVEAEVSARGTASLKGRAHFRIASVHAAAEAAAAVDLVYEAGGGTSIYAKSPLQRAFRDVHVATQHVMVSATTATLAGRILLDVETDTSML
jgi:alkylation response protein AidB-like acyl-CoA dehydrogenase